jgi:transposase InsO family protein
VDKARFLVETHLRTNKPIAELAAAHGVHRSWLYKKLARFRREGEAGLEPRSRRPKRSPTRTSSVWEQRVIVQRKQLADAGLDAGAETIRYHLGRRYQSTVPSISTIWRVLRAAGFVTPQPHKRPKTSYKRFAAELPNECWQADVTHWTLADGRVVEILNMIDDHSRLCVASRVFITARSGDVVRTLHRAAAILGYPNAFLTDNGAIFTASYRGGEAALQAALLSLGIRSKHSRPYHPQTCGKVERFHQTQKKFLAKQPAATTTKQLQRQLDRFAAYYNQQRPHRAIGRRTPAQAYTARQRAHPTGPIINCAGYRVRHDKVSRGGSVTVRYRSRLHHIGIGRAYTGWRVILLIAGRDIRVLTPDGDPLRQLKLDPTVDYQPQP